MPVARRLLSTAPMLASRFALAAFFLFACGDDGSSVGHDAGSVFDAGAIDAGTDAGGTDAGSSIDPRFAELAAAVERDIAASNATAASVAVWLDDEIVWVGGFGSLGDDRRPGEDTVFMIGSDTKKIAAILFLQDVAAGRATEETTIAEVLPDLEMRRAPEFAGALASELLSHRGGIVDTVGDVTSTTTDELLRTHTFGPFARNAYAMAPHGVFFNYSNPNFSLAGLMTETLGERPWADLARERLFVPLEMTRTFARKADVDADHAEGVGYEGAGDVTLGPVAFDRTWENAFARPAGHVWSTPSDQMRLARFLVDGDDEVLPAALVARLHQPITPTYPDLAEHYGYGLFVAEGIRIGAGYYETPRWSHGGNTLTHTSTFVVLPEQRFAISILSNGLGDDFDSSVRAAIESLVTLPEPRPVTPPPFDEAALDGLTGSYLDEYNVGRVTVTRESASLVLAMPDLDAAGISYEPRMTAISTRVWSTTIDDTPVVLSFFDGPGGETYLVHRAFVAVRESGKPEPVPPPMVRPGRARPAREALERLFRASALEPRRDLPAR
jgi:CubicO group peptidase (beta-lactamase class C family)